MQSSGSNGLGPVNVVITCNVSSQPESSQIRAVFSSPPTSCFQSAPRLPAKKFWKGCDHCGLEGDGNEQMKHQVKTSSNLITSSSSSPASGSFSAQ